MSMPPEDGWQPSQQPGPPPNPGQPYGQQFNPSAYNPQQPPPPGWQQGSWPQQSGPPPQKGSNLKWLLIAVAILLVVAVSIGGTLLFTRDGAGGGGTSPSSRAQSDIASANDTGPVKVITDEPTCKTYNGINNALADVQANGWPAMRVTLGLRSAWTPEQLAKVAAVSTSVRNAADQLVPLAKQTPNRVVREIYEQFVAYGRAYASSVPTYTPADDGLASAWVSAANTMTGICNSIEFNSSSRSLALERAAMPTKMERPGNPSDPQRFVTSSSTTCREWNQRLDKFNAESSPEWQDRDTSISASQWTPEQRALMDAARPLLESYASDIEAAGRQSVNPVFEDLASTAALYIQSYLTAGDNYINADGWLNYTGFQIANLVYGACLAVAG